MMIPTCEIQPMNKMTDEYALGVHGSINFCDEYAAVVAIVRIM